MGMRCRYSFYGRRGIRFIHIRGKEEEQADRAEENSIKPLIQTCKELIISKESVIRKPMEKKGLSSEAAVEKVTLYWKE